MKRLVINNFGRLAGERILVNGEWWMILSAIGDEKHLGILQFVGRDEMLLIENQVHNVTGYSYVRAQYLREEGVLWNSLLLISDLKDMNTALIAIAKVLS
jgi:hypothetical protein